MDNKKNKSKNLGKIKAGAIRSDISNSALNMVPFNDSGNGLVQTDTDPTVVALNSSQTLVDPSRNEIDRPVSLSKIDSSDPEPASVVETEKTSQDFFFQVLGCDNLSDQRDRERFFVEHLRHGATISTFNSRSFKDGIPTYFTQAKGLFLSGSDDSISKKKVENFIRVLEFIGHPQSKACRFYLMGISDDTLPDFVAKLFSMSDCSAVLELGDIPAITKVSILDYCTGTQDIYSHAGSQHLKDFSDSKRMFIKTVIEYMEVCGDPNDVKNLRFLFHHYDSQSDKSGLNDLYKKLSSLATFDLTSLKEFNEGKKGDVKHLLSVKHDHKLISCFNYTNHQQLEEICDDLLSRSVEALKADQLSDEQFIILLEELGHPLANCCRMYLMCLDTESDDYTSFRRELETLSSRGASFSEVLIGRIQQADISSAEFDTKTQKKIQALERKVTYYSEMTEQGSYRYPSALSAARLDLQAHQNSGGVLFRAQIIIDNFEVSNNLTGQEAQNARAYCQMCYDNYREMIEEEVQLVASLDEAQSNLPKEDGWKHWAADGVGLGKKAGTPRGRVATITAELAEVRTKKDAALEALKNLPNKVQVGLTDSDCIELAKFNLKKISRLKKDHLVSQLRWNPHRELPKVLLGKASKAVGFRPGEEHVGNPFLSKYNGYQVLERMMKSKCGASGKAVSSAVDFIDSKEKANQVNALMQVVTTLESKSGSDLALTPIEKNLAEFFIDHLEFTFPKDGANKNQEVLEVIQYVIRGALKPKGALKFQLHHAQRDDMDSKNELKEAFSQDKSSNQRAFCDLLVAHGSLTGTLQGILDGLEPAIQEGRVTVTGGTDHSLRDGEGQSVETLNPLNVNLEDGGRESDEILNVKDTLEKFLPLLQKFENSVPFTQEDQQCFKSLNLSELMTQLNSLQLL